MIQHNARLSQISTKIWKILSRNIKTKVEEVKKVKYTDTINLPKTKFPARLNQQQRTDVEDVIRAVSNLFYAGILNFNFDNFQGHLGNLYEWQRNHLKSPNSDYVLHDGPPYANGDLHMGHAVNKVGIFVSGLFK